MTNLVFKPNLVPKRRLSHYSFSPSLSLSLSLSLIDTHTENSNPSLLPLSNLSNSLFSHSHTPSLMAKTRVLQLASCTLFESVPWRQLVPQPWKRVFYFCFWVWVFVCVWGLYPKCQGNVGQRPTSSPTTSGRRSFSSFFVLFFFFSLLFWFLLVWVLVNLGIGFSYGDKGLVIFYFGLKGGIQVWLFANLWSCGCFLIWGLSQNGSNMVFLQVYAYESVYVWQLGIFGGVLGFRICMSMCVCLCFMTWCSHVV